jgi:hypothetical protein
MHLQIKIPNPMNLNLPPVILSILKQRGGYLDPKLRATQAQLVQTCEAHGYAAHPSVIDFEAAFGGLVLPDELPMVDGEPCWLFGAYACLASNGHVAPRGGSKARKLVPVVYSPNDVIYFLDAQGRAYAQDTIEDTSATLFAENGTALVCRILLNEFLFARGETTLDLPGLQGDALAQRLSLALINEASGLDRRFYSDAQGEVLVVEDIKAKRTQIAAATQAQLELVKPPAAADAPPPSAEMLPWLGKAHVRMVGEQRTTLPEFFEHLPEVRELDVSINRLTTLPEALWRATQITSLDLGFNPLTALPEGIGRLKALTSLLLRGCPLAALPDALAGAKKLTNLRLTESDTLDIDAALLVIAKLPKLKTLSLPLSRSLTSLAPLAHLPLKSLVLSGLYVKCPNRLPAGLGQLKKLTDLRIEYADEIAQLPEDTEDIRALRLLFSKRFTDDDIRKSALRQPSKLYLQAYAATL